MAKDPLARKITVNYSGGSLTMTQGNYLDLFGEDTDAIGAPGEPVSIGVKQHQRVRVIGTPPKTIERYTKEFIQWPTNSRDGAAGGTSVVMEWIGSEGPWEARVSGSLWELGSFLQNTSPKSVWFHAKGGKGYGPFKKIS
jgi:hypothetical protein